MTVTEVLRGARLAFVMALRSLEFRPNRAMLSQQNKTGNLKQVASVLTGSIIFNSSNSTRIALRSRKLVRQIWLGRAKTSPELKQFKPKTNHWTANPEC